MPVCCQVCEYSTEKCFQQSVIAEWVVEGGTQAVSLDERVGGLKVPKMFLVFLVAPILKYFIDLKWAKQHDHLALSTAILGNISRTMASKLVRNNSSTLFQSTL